MPGDIIQEIKDTCRESLSHTGMKINEEGIKAFWANLDEADWSKFHQEHGAKFPLNYSDALDELNFLSVLTILNFLSAYRIQLHKRTGQGAYDTIRRFVMACYLAQMQGELENPLSASGMAHLSEHITAEFLRLPTMTEKDHPTLPMRIGEPDKEAKEIVQLVQGVMNETGNILLKSGKKNLGAWVADTLKQTTDLTAQERASYLVKALANTFPAFRDEGDVQGYRVKVYKKAQLLTFIIGTEFKDRSDVPFPLPATETITATVDNVVPTMAVHFKLLDISNSKYSVYANGLGQAGEAGVKVQGITQTAEEAYAIRAGTVAAIERAIGISKEVAASKGKSWLSSIRSMGLDGYLWSKAKDGDLRNLPRLSEPGTVMY
ncbi:hypothetical protein P389DRAFT_74342 [Cystobasidium minutum MCA 4210]|uniref:uncharacterized protein n=1 Tax=Cystobasidium minutum MCA 4210 TaxID=1397322 RepID=UPI0034CF0F2F|eukprot:jgi/Rhomi1/74342/CE74341_3167